MKTQFAGKWIIGGAIIMGALMTRGVAQESQGGTTVTAIAVNKNNESVAEVLKMLDAKVSKEVIKAYIDGSTAPCNPTAADIIALKEHGATDDITTALLKRGTEVRAQAAQAAVANAGAVAAAPVRLDPESYDYFTQYYLYPRTLASVNQRLGIYPAPYPYGGYGGYYPAMPFGPYYGNFGFRGSFQPMRNGHFH